MKICETERIIIREFTQDDTKPLIDMTADGSLWELFGDCSKAVDWMGKWIGDSKEITERDNPYEEYLAYAIVDKKTKDVIGSVGCSVYEDLHEIGIAYCIGSKYRGKGFAKEAASAYTKYFFEHYPNMKRMIATIRQDNIVSNRVIKSAGYKLETTKTYKDINDEEEAMYNFYVYDNNAMQQNESKKSSLFERISRHEKTIRITSSIIAIVTVLYPIINSVHNFSYQSDCEQFYNVPGKYFNDNIGKNILFIVLLAVLLLFAIAPAIMRKYEIKKGIETKATQAYIILLTVYLGFMVGIVNACNLELIMRRTNNNVINSFINAHAMPIIICITIMFIISLLCIVLMKEIKDMKYKVVKMIIKVVFFISGLVSIMLMIYGTMFKLGTEVKDITKYEFVEKDNQYYIVVSDYNGKKVVMKYYNDNGTCVIDTDKYYFIDDQATFSYRDLGNPPKRKNID